MAASPRSVTFPLVDGLRAVAALSIVGLHVGLGGWYGAKGALGDYGPTLAAGVTLFFVISGFLLYRPFVSARVAEARQPRLKRYLMRRGLRILPAYWVALTLLALVLHLPGVLSNDWWRYYSLAQIYDGETFAQGMRVAWTLCIEATFYLALPVYVVLARHLCRRSLSRELVLLAGFFIASLIFRAVMRSPGDPVPTQNLLGTFDWFALGMLVAVISVHRPGWRIRRPGLMWLAAAPCFLAASLLPEVGTYRDLALHLLYGAMSVLLLLPAVAGSGGVPQLILGNAVLAWVGRISYGIYLYHEPLITPLAQHRAETRMPGPDYLWLLAATLAVTIPLAAVSYYAVERPLLRPRAGGPAGENERHAGVRSQLGVLLKRRARRV